MLAELSAETIDRIFDEADSQGEYVIGLYRVAYPEWDEIEKVDGFPAISERTGKYIMEKAVKFDKIHHPDSFNGGLWMNSGFSVISSDPPKDWMVRPAHVILKSTA